MNLSFITPTAYLEKYATRGDIYLALAHLIDDKGANKYSTFHRREAKKGRKVILDNGLFENAQVSTESLLRRAELIGAQVVCAPDSLYDHQGTIKQFKQFIRAKQEYGLVAKVMGIPQADNPNDWWECFRFMELSKDCDIVGLSILSIPRSFNYAVKYSKQPITYARMHIIRQLYAYESLLGRRIKQCHLLGLGESYGDVVLSKRLLPNSILSNDSSSAFVHGYAGTTYSQLGNLKDGKISKKLDFGIKTLDTNQERCIETNIDIALEIANRHYDY